MKNLPIKKYILRTFFSLIILANLTLIITKKISGSLISEMIVSFEPYSFLLSILALITFLPLIIWIITNQVRKKENARRFMRKNSLFFISFTLLFSNSLWMGVEVLGYYYPVTKTQDSLSQGVKIGFYNKYFPNVNFSEINSELSKLDLDILGMGELTRKQIPYIEKLRDYKYSYTENCVCEYPEDVALYSKYPITNPSTYALLGGRVIEATVEIEDKNIKVFVVHTTAPMTKFQFNLRNQELPELAKIINSKQADGTIVMGDFNTAPWSVHYKNFQSDLPQLKNTAENAGIRFTWGTSPLKTHLDHIFIPEEWAVGESKVEGRYGSDHHLVWASVYF